MGLHFTAAAYVEHLKHLMLGHLALTALQLHLGLASCLFRRLCTHCPLSCMHTSVVTVHSGASAGVVLLDIVLG